MFVSYGYSEKIEYVLLVAFKKRRSLNVVWIVFYLLNTTFQLFKRNPKPFLRNGIFTQKCMCVCVHTCVCMYYGKIQSGEIFAFIGSNLMFK